MNPITKIDKLLTIFDKILTYIRISWKCKNSHTIISILIYHPYYAMGASMRQRERCRSLRGSHVRPQQIGFQSVQFFNKSLIKVVELVIFPMDKIISVPDLKVIAASLEQGELL